MQINWVSVEVELPDIGEKVLTCDKKFPDCGFEWECRIGSESDVDWSSSYSVSHFARLSVDEI